MYIRPMSVPVDAEELCLRDPTQRGCVGFCEANPEEVECIADICSMDATARGCTQFCDANPTDPDC